MVRCRQPSQALTRLHRGPDEQHRRFYIFGEYINCVRWEGKFYITGPDVFKVQNALYRLENCTAAPQKRRFEETILTQLRAISEEAGMRIEPSGSPFINLLYGLGAVRTRKRQKVFEWDAVQVRWRAAKCHLTRLGVARKDV